MQKKTHQGFQWSWVKEHFWHVLAVIVIWEIVKAIIALIILLATKTA